MPDFHIINQRGVYMKLLTKIAIYILTLIIFTLTACTTHTPPAQPLTSFTASVVCNNEKFTVVHSGKTLTSVTYHTPQSLNGLTYTYQNNSVSIKYLSLSYTPSNNTLPTTNHATQLYNLLTSISGSNCYLLSTTENTATYTLPTAQVICNATTGRIIEIKLKNNSTKYTFSYSN